MEERHLTAWPRIVVLGDSIAFGEHGPSSEAWPTLLAHDFPKHTVANRSVCGDTTRLALERFGRDVKAAQPSIVIVQLGHNDAQDWDGQPRVLRASFAGNMREIVARCLRCDAQVVLCTPHPTRRGAQYEYRCDAYAADIRAVDYGDQLSVCDVRTFWPDLQGLLLDDGLHLSAAGHRAMADLVGGTLREVLA